MYWGFRRWHWRNWGTNQWGSRSHQVGFYSLTSFQNTNFRCSCISCHIGFKKVLWCSNSERRILHLKSIIQFCVNGSSRFWTIHKLVYFRSGDPSLMVVVSNNLICINKDQNVFDTRKRIKASSIDDLQYKLFQAQRSSILANQALFYLNNNQVLFRPFSTSYYP